METVSFTIPDSPDMVRSVGELLIRHADRMEAPSTVTVPVAEEVKHVVPPAPVEDALPPAPVEESIPQDSALVPSEASPPAPIEDAAPPAPVETGIELDTAGLPWDARIHSKGRAKLVKGGQWKKKRGVAADLVASVEAELRAVTPASEPVNIGTQDAPPPAPVTEAIPPAPTDAGVINFPTLIQRVVAAGLKTEDLQPTLDAFGIESMALLAPRPELIPGVFAALFPQG